MGFAVLALLTAVSAPAEKLDWERVEKLYRWGEYDSIVAIVQPWVRKPETGTDPLFSKAMACLGVAFHGLGDSVQGDAAFTAALQQEPLLGLDRHYVSAPIHVRFQGLAAARKPKASAASIQSPIVLKPPQPGDAPSKIAEPRPKEKKRIRTWIYFGSGAALVAAAGATYLILQPSPTLESSTHIDFR